MGARPRVAALLLALLAGSLWTVTGKPALDVQQGPCVGMDCLHGVLMHGDGEQGTDHNTEDQYLRFQEALKTGAEKAGPADAEQEFHGVLMHTDGERGETHEERGDILPENVKQDVLPKDVNEELHEGMHGAEGADKHEWDNQEGEGKVVSAGDHGKIMHGVLMHGNEDHTEHGADAENAEDGEGGENKAAADHDKLMHGMLMHGDENFVHDPAAELSDEVGNVGPETAEEMLHGVLMHADKTPGTRHSHGEENNGVSSGLLRKIGPSSDSLHGILMHGDSENGKDHAEEDASTMHEVFSDFSKILELELDMELLKMIDLEQILKNNIEEYKAWILNKPEHEDSKEMGSTYIDRSLLEDIQLMKRRYLNKNDDDDDYDYNTEYMADDTPFTAEDARSALTAHAQSGEGEDMRHDLELMGSTDPLNDRHAHAHALRSEPHEET